jgi:HEAT repeat protein
MRRLKSTNPDTVANAAVALGKLKAIKAIPQLIEVLPVQYEMKGVNGMNKAAAPKWAAAWALGEMGPHAVPFVRKSLSNEDERVKYMVLRSIGYLGLHARALAPEVVCELNTGSNRCRYAAADALAQSGNRESYVKHALLAALNDQHKGVRASAIVALMKLFPNDAVILQAVVAMKGDPERMVRDAVESVLIGTLR